MAPTKKVLVAVLGNTPAILTEAFYFYARKGIVFSRIIVFTTSEGRSMAHSLLLGRKGAFRRLLGTLGLRSTDVAFDTGAIHVLSADGKELKDAADAGELFTMADEMYNHLKPLFQPDEEIYATIAGGRKSMGACLGMVFQLFARPGKDCLFHVLVDPSLEREAEFFFPGDSAWKKKELNPSVVKCTEIPVLYWPWSQEERPATFRDLWAQRQRELLILADPPKLVIDKKKHLVRIGDVEFALKPVECFHYCILADLRRSGKGPLRFTDFSNDLEFVQQAGKPCPTLKSDTYGDFLEHYRRLFHEVIPSKPYANKFPDRLSQDFLGVDAGSSEGGDPALRTSISNIRRAIVKALGVSSQIASVYCIENIGERNDARYLIRLDPNKIKLG